jgi:hypothetical protein
MTRPGLLAVVVAAVALGTTAVWAQPSTPDQADGRFTFHRADDGYLRLDGRTGQVSKCDRRPSGWQCQVVPDERSALEIEIARLQGDNAALKKALLTHNLALPNGIRPDLPASKSNGPQTQDKERVEVNRFMVIIENVWRRLVELVASVQREILRWV